MNHLRPYPFQNALGYVWDVALLDWVAEQQAVLNATNVSVDLTGTSAAALAKLNSALPPIANLASGSERGIPALTVETADGYPHSFGGPGDWSPMGTDSRGRLFVNGSTVVFTQAMDYDGNSNLIYFGMAPLGSSKASAVWQIRKFTYDGSNNLTDVQYAGGDDTFVNAWTSRASLSYS
jgi:hypothetical protein